MARPLRIRGAISKCLRYLIVIGLPKRYGPPREWGLATVLFPVFALAIGAVDWGLYWAGSKIWPLPVALVVPWALSFLHSRCKTIDGLADLGDAFSFRRDPERMKRILKDPSTGAFGVLVVVVVLALNLAGLLSLPPDRVGWFLFTTPMIARWSTLVMFWRSKPAYELSSLSEYLEGFNSGWFLVATIFTIAVAAPAMGPFHFSVIMVIAATTGLAVRRSGHRRLGGVQGDMVGATYEFTVIGILLGANIRVPSAVWSSWNDLLTLAGLW